MGLGDIEAYMYQADLYCGVDVLQQVMSRYAPNDPWIDGASIEDQLNRYAERLGINRSDERTFDSEDYPKVVLSQHLNEPDDCGDGTFVARFDHCGSCGDCLGHDPSDCAIDTDAPEHTEYPHQPGTLYDCPGCEAQCHCDHIRAQWDASYTQCVFCALLKEKEEGKGS